MRATMLLLLLCSGSPAAVPTGGHGFGINPNTRNPSPVATTWQLRLGDWLKQIGMLK